MFQSPAKYKEISGFLERIPTLFWDVEVQNQALRFLKNCRKYNKNGQQYYYESAEAAAPYVCFIVVILVIIIHIRGEG
jgi:hypothetical protein